jgi:hypothetical protein
VSISIYVDATNVSAPVTRNRWKVLAGTGVTVSAVLAAAGVLWAYRLGDTPNWVVWVELAAFLVLPVALVFGLLGRSWTWSILALVAMPVTAWLTLAAALANAFRHGFF